MFFMIFLTFISNLNEVWVVNLFCILNAFWWFWFIFFKILKCISKLCCIFYTCFFAKIKRFSDITTVHLCIGRHWFDNIVLVFLLNLYNSVLFWFCVKLILLLVSLMIIVNSSPACYVISTWSRVFLKVLISDGSRCHFLNVMGNLVEGVTFIFFNGQLLKIKL
jgi:hypothetical protein